jgi:all-trans-retinol 13,14-reductase
MDHSNESDNYSDLLLTAHALEVISHPSQKWDTIVVGSGMGGLTAAAALVKGAHERVLLLEKHTKLGGCTHEFRERGVDFDTGLHYVGARIWEPTSAMRKVTDSITDSQLQWERLDDVYDVAVVDGERFNMRSGIAKQKADLKQRFPDFKKEIDAYFKAVEDESSRFSAYMKRQLALSYIPRGFVLKDRSFGQETVSQALDRLKITDKTLRAVLTYLHGDYGAGPDEASWSEHAVVIAHYCTGAAYPVGGSGKIARLVLSVIESCGGRAATRATVESILIEKGVAVGVVLKGGHVIRANKVISCVGAYHTFVNLLPNELENDFPFLIEARRDLQSDHLKTSPAHAMTFLALRGTAKSLGLPKANWWVQDNPRFESVFISFPSAKDPTWESRYPDTSVCEIVVEADPELFAKWKNDPVKNRSPDYLKLKQDLADSMCDILFKHFPQLKDKVDFRDASTPLSAEHFLGSKHGCAYGLACTPNRYTAEWLKPATDIKNLYLGAQDIVSCGIAGSLMGGLISACSASFKTLWHYGKVFAVDKPATESEDQWNTMDEVDAGGVLF